MRVPKFLLALACALVTSHAAAQSWPDRNRPIKFLLPWGAASSTDLLSRALAKAITDEFGQPVVVENKPGAEGFIGVQAAAGAPSDGYTVMVTSMSTQVLNPHMHASLPTDPIKEFVPVTVVARFSLVMNAGPSTQFRNAGEFIAAARKDPGKYKFGSASAMTRLGGELFQQLAGVQLVHVPYKTTAQGVIGTGSGEVDLMFADVPSSSAQLQAGRIRPLATTGQSRMKALPNVPTLVEQGLPEYELSGWFGAYVPAGTPKAIAARLAEMIHKAMERQSMRDFLAAGALEAYPVAGDKFAEFQLKELDRWGRMMRASGISAKK